MHGFLRGAVAQGVLRPLDYHFARRMAALAGADDDAPLLLAAALASQRTGEGDVCADLNRGDDYRLLQLAAADTALPAAQQWAAELRRHAVVGQPGDYAPLILDQRQRLYLGRYWHFEQVLAQSLLLRAPVWAEGVDRDRLKEGLERLFASSDEPDWQRIAAALAVLRRFCVISGGPGTGKTRTVTSILALLLEQEQSTPLRIGLAAPTGKAAMRLSESIRAAKAKLTLSPEVASRIPEEAVTLHRLLGFRPGRANPRHGAEHPLHWDVLVVDEASMVDLPMMARLLQALPESTRLILLGDRDQLASVEAGMVLGDICGESANGYSVELCAALQQVAGVPLVPAPQAPAIADCLVMLRKSWRFGDASGIGALARAINAGDGDQALAVLDDPTRTDVLRLAPSSGQPARLIRDRLLPMFRQLLACQDPAEALAIFNRQRILCALREGPLGVLALNRQIEQMLEREGLIRCQGPFYAGRPVMVTVNDHAQQLYNGDIALLLPDAASDGQLRAFFETSEGVRRVLPSRLPHHETVYAMTVHKSQGSEFERVLMLLPDTQTRVVTRELIYTGVTRASQEVTLLADAQWLVAAIDNRVRRSSGLRERLWR
jgi:exodeoxyribonuclease V alpha subunit